VTDYAGYWLPEALSIGIDFHDDKADYHYEEEFPDNEATRLAIDNTVKALRLNLRGSEVTIGSRRPGHVYLCVKAKGAPPLEPIGYFAVELASQVPLRSKAVDEDTARFQAGIQYALGFASKGASTSAKAQKYLERIDKAMRRARDHASKANLTLAQRLVGLLTFAWAEWLYYREKGGRLGYNAFLAWRTVTPLTYGHFAAEES